jgi:glycerophosphoryl diester phosphodiesterase
LRAASLPELRGLRLVADTARTTPYPVPILAEALAWAEGRAVLQLDVKEDVPRKRVADLLRRMDALDQALVITDALAEARWYHRRLPALVLSVTADTPDAATAVLKAVDPSRLVAFVGVGPPSDAVLRVFRRAGVPVTVGTFGALDRQARQRGLVVYRDLFRQGVDVIATDETALGHQAADTYRPQSTSEPRP